MDKKPTPGWIGYYTKRTAEKPRRWFPCRVLAHDGDVVVFKTRKGHYVGKDIKKYEFSRHVPEGEAQMPGMHSVEEPEAVYDEAGRKIPPTTERIRKG